MLEYIHVTDFRDPLGLAAEIDKHRVMAERKLGPVVLVSSGNAARPDPDNVNKHIYSVRTTWRPDNAPGS